MSEKNTAARRDSSDNRVRQSPAATGAQRKPVPGQRRNMPAAGKKRPSGKKNGANPVLVKLWNGVRTVFAGIGKGFGRLNHLLDGFRKDEVSTVIVNALAVICFPRRPVGRFGWLQSSHRQAG